MKKQSLKLKLILGGIIAVLVPVLVIGSFAVYQSRKALEDGTLSQSVEIAKSLSQTVDLAVQEEMKIVQQVAQRGVVITGVTKYNEGVHSCPEIDMMTEEIKDLFKKNGSDYVAFFATSLDGKIISSEATQFDISDRDYFLSAKSGKVSVGNIVRSKQTGKLVLSFAAPIYTKSGEIIGVLVATLNNSFIADKLAATKMGKTGYVTLVDKTGLILAHPNQDYILKLNLLEHESLKKLGMRMSAGETGTEIYSHNGVKKVTGFAPVTVAGWSICINQDYSELMAPADRMTLIIVVVAVIFLVLVAVGVFFLARGIALPIGRIAEDLDDASDQVAAASSQVASASQSLAEGSSELASALEETSSSLEEMSSMTRQNADNAAQARSLTGEAAQNVTLVGELMDKMAAAIQDVTRSSEETGKIIKTIDEIAFQTNLLALNAAVEAARAGEAGAGFAVVADEVRNLAMRSAEAAKNTSDLIEDTIGVVKRSRDLTQQTQEAFRNNMEIAMKVGQLIDEVAAASNEQSQGIGQIGKAVSEMDKVVQRTAANAEESASASEEMNAQAMQMKTHVSSLVAIIDGGNTKNFIPAPGRYMDGDGEGTPAGPKPGKPVVKNLLTAGTHMLAKSETLLARKAIPMEKDGFVNF